MGTTSPVTLRSPTPPSGSVIWPSSPSTSTRSSSRFGAGVRLVDYETDYEAARELINDVGERTRPSSASRISLAPGTIDALTRLVLVNAIYLKAPWLMPFSRTRRPTHPSRGRTGARSRCR